uniref:periodic tryptophan protein 2 homolog n=1 Tax=Styela clava TaxID=7725 RepID=UPI00193A5534|nr:periodic tryptophan protein 2 homolog [Styela clava]
MRLSTKRVKEESSIKIMKYTYKFSNLLGTIYKKGNVEFLPRKDILASPVGNRISLFNLKENSSETLSFTTKYNIACVAFSPDGRLVIVIDENGNASLVSLLSQTVIHRFTFRKPVTCIKFDPAGTKFAVAMEKLILLYHAPGKTREINPFTLYRTYHGAYDTITTFDWTDDSTTFAAGSKDMNTRIYTTIPGNPLLFSLGGHKDEIVGCFFESNSLDIYTISKDGALNVWESNIDLENLGKKGLNRKDRRALKILNPGVDEEESEMKTELLNYHRVSKYFFNKEGNYNEVTCVAYHKKNHVLATGFSSGSFSLHELPGFNWIHSLNISEQRISTACFNPSGDWLSLACSSSGQLLVWEWHSETYVLKQHGHFNNMRCLDYSPDGRYIVSGGEDSKVKVWNTLTGFCFVTFTEHTSSVTGVQFTRNGHVIVSASLDGTVRAFDMHRYRNFRTFTSPHPVQFVSLAVDYSADLICAGSNDNFNIFLWSMQTGRLLDVLAGHEGPVVSLCFSSAEALLASGSWDGTVKLWSVLETKSARETITLNQDVLAIAFKPDGSEIAVSTLNAEITFWDVQTAKQMGSIECKYDIIIGRNENDRISAKSKSQGKAYDCISYISDGQCVIAGGKFASIGIYNVKEGLLVKKFTVSQNLSFDGMEEFLDKRKMTEFGPSALIDTDESNEKLIKLPGVQKGDMCSRSFKPEVRVSGVKFSPAGRDWAAVTTEGLVIYSLDNNFVFDPFDLEISITPELIRQKIEKDEYAEAIVVALRLNEVQLICEAIESTPIAAIEMIVSGLRQKYVEKLLEFISTQLDKSCHFHFYILWTKYIFLHHATQLKQRQNKVLGTIMGILKKLTIKKEGLGAVCEKNSYQIQYIIAMSKYFGSKRKKISEEESDIEDEIMDDVSEDSGLSLS